ncbi:hypothetical protein [Neptuniibacter halophilus]|uniref:hypothetical protein n=1 Tax=Neptuniibacter halophilus TaxID=651666 RepID=UPI0025731E44|nr:hypothetical protein [Neptuniibacter halophilus]
MQNNAISPGLNPAFTTGREGLQTGNSATPNNAQPVAAPEQPNQVALNPELPPSSQVSQTSSTDRPATNNPGGADQGIDPVARQLQIESFLAEQTGESPENFRGIDLQSALDLQENLRNRPAPAAAEASDETPPDSNAVQDQALQERLQSRLAQQIPNDPGTEFPQLIETVA